MELVRKLDANAARVWAAGNATLLGEVQGRLEEVRGHQERVLTTLVKLGHSMPGGPAAAASRPSSVMGQGTEAEALGAALSELEALWAHVPHAEYLHAAKAQALLRLGK